MQYMKIQYRPILLNCIQHKCYESVSKYPREFTKVFSTQRESIATDGKILVTAGLPKYQHSLQHVLHNAKLSEEFWTSLSPEALEELKKVVIIVDGKVKRHEGVDINVNSIVGTQVSTKATISFAELKAVALQNGLPFVGFGFVDNSIMILAGDYIDLTLGVTLGISSMAAAGIGNIIADVSGVGVGSYIEGICSRLGIPKPDLTLEQQMLKQTRYAKAIGSCVGVIIGCVFGMFPLLFLETRTQEPKEEESDR